MPVREVRESTLPGPAGDIPIRIYSPASADAGPQAGLVYLHGGASDFYSYVAVWAKMPTHTVVTCVQ